MLHLDINKLDFLSKKNYLLVDFHLIISFFLVLIIYLEKKLIYLPSFLSIFKKKW